MSGKSSEAKVLTELLSHGHTGEESADGLDFWRGVHPTSHLQVSEILCGRASRVSLGVSPPIAGLVLRKEQA